MRMQKFVRAKPMFDNSRKIYDRSVRPLLALSIVEGFTLNRVEGCRTKDARWSGVPSPLTFISGSG
jgi:hypothetical protein